LDTNVDLLAERLLDYKDVKQNSMFGWGDNPFKIETKQKRV
jgi:hypothetical protein